MRALIILLALLLPMQLSWAAVASYCQAENDRTPAHVGHHEHASVKAEKLDDHADSGQTKNGNNDADCSLCHFSCLKPVQFHGSKADVPPSAEQDARPVCSPYPTSHIADGPDKPNWQLAA